MNPTLSAVSHYEMVCRAILQFILTGVLRVALPVALGLCTLRVAGRWGIEARRVLANAIVACGVSALLVSTLFVWARPPIPVIWNLRIPAASTAAIVFPGSLSFQRNEHLVGTRQASPTGSVLSGVDEASLALAVSGVESGVLHYSGSQLSGQKLALSPRPSSINGATSLGGLAIDTTPTTDGSMSPGAPREPVNSTLPGILTIATTLCWLAGTVVLLLWLVATSISTHMRLTRSRLVEDEQALALIETLCLRHDVCPPQLVCVHGLVSPFMSGIRNATLALPDSYAEDFEPGELRAIFAHEVMHLAQRDCLWALLSRLLCAFCWPLPIVWVLCGQREALSEEACDMAVLKDGCSPTVYARCLLVLAERLRPYRTILTTGVGAVRRRSGLGRRIEVILGASRSSRSQLSRFGRMALVSAAIGVTVPCVVLVGQASPHGFGTRAQDVEAPQSTGSAKETARDDRAQAVERADVQVEQAEANLQAQQAKLQAEQARVRADQARLFALLASRRAQPAADMDQVAAMRARLKTHASGLKKSRSASADAKSKAGVARKLSAEQAQVEQVKATADQDVAAAQQAQTAQVEALAAKAADLAASKSELQRAKADELSEKAALAHALNAAALGKRPSDEIAIARARRDALLQEDRAKLENENAAADQALAKQDAELADAKARLNQAQAEAQKSAGVSDQKAAQDKLQSQDQVTRKVDAVAKQLEQAIRLDLQHIKLEPIKLEPIKVVWTDKQFLLELFPPQKRSIERLKASQKRALIDKLQRQNAANQALISRLQTELKRENQSHR